MEQTILYGVATANLFMIIEITCAILSLAPDPTDLSDTTYRIMPDYEYIVGDPKKIIKFKSFIS
jgi:hypothetical protein